MLRIIVSLLLIFTFINSVSIYAEIPSNDDLPRYLYISLNNKDDILLLNKKTNNVLVANQFKSISSFVKTKTGWLASAQAKNKKRGYINNLGEWIVKPEFDKAKSFSEDDIARVYKDKKWGFIKSDGSYLIEPTFYDVTPFQYGLSAVQAIKNGDYYYINTKGEKVFSTPFCGARIFTDSGLAAVKVCPSIPVYEIGLDQVKKTKTNGRGLWTYINKQGEKIFAPRFLQAGNFNKFNIASVLDNGSSNGSRLINIEGEFINDTHYEYLWGFSRSGVAWSQKAGSKQDTGYIDTKGDLVWKASYHDFSGEHNGLLVNHRKGFQVFDPFGQLVIKDKSTWLDDFQDAKVTVALRDNQWGILSREGAFKIFPENIIAPLTNSYSDIIGFVDGIIPMINKEREIVFFDRTGALKYQLTSNENNIMTLYDNNHKALWESGKKKSKVASLLAPSIYEHFTDPNEYGDGILKTTKALLANKPRKYFIPNPLYSSRGSNPYDLNADIDELKKGAIKIVASSYVGEGEWGRYEFLGRLLSDAFSKYRGKIERAITKKYGDPIKNKYSTTQWQIEDKILKLSHLSDSGDGDFYHQIILEVNSKNNNGE